MKPAWFPDWTGKVTAIVASGPSVTQEDVDRLRGRCKTIVINNGFRLAPWADVLYAADGKWWDVYKEAQDFSGLKVAPDVPASRGRKLTFIPLVESNIPAAENISLDPGVIGRGGGNSGFQSLNLALQFGARRILLLGYDFFGDHWHGKHVEPLKNPRPAVMVKWRERIDAQAPLLKSIGAEVINASTISTLVAFPKMNIEEALGRWAK